MPDFIIISEKDILKWTPPKTYEFPIQFIPDPEETPKSKKMGKGITRSYF
mgnify:CR=1 FL=1